MQVGAAVAVVLLSIFINAEDRQAFLFADLLECSKRLPPGHESAAFVVRDADFSVHSVRWPDATTARQSTYRGAIPIGTIAIAHTHPELAHLRMPSPRDVALAQETGLDIYVVTRAEVWVAKGRSGRVMRVISNGRWPRRAHQPPHSRPGLLQAVRGVELQ